MKDQSERPEVYALRQDGAGWQMTRRDFLKAAGISAAVMGIGLPSRFVKPAHAASDLETLCASSPAHEDHIWDLKLTVDGKYLLSVDEALKTKCWDFSSHALLSSELGDSGITESVILDGKTVIIRTTGNTLNMFELPDQKELTGETVKVNLDGVSKITALDTDTDGNIYGVSEGSIFSLKHGPLAYEAPELLYEAASGEKLSGIRVLAAGEALFVLKNSGYGVLNLRDRSMKSFAEDQSFGAYAILPGGTKALLGEENSSHYQLVSLINGEVIWEQNLDQKILSAVVTPDGSFGVLAGDQCGLILISMNDGSEVRRLTAAEDADAPLAIAKDGSAFAAAVNQSILFISLPDFEIIGCPVDISEMTDDTEGIEVSGVDPVTGQTVTYTLPCGAPIPAGAVCVCNCVAGTVCSCVGHTVCTCVGYTCSCVGNTCSCVGNVVTYSYTYWYPN